MPRENAAAKAKRLLGEGRVLLTRVVDREVDAIVRGDSGEFYAVSHRPGSWVCPCAALSGACSHVQALMLVTAPARRENGWRSIAEITDTWREAPLEPWERIAEPPIHGNDRRTAQR